jgi:predicted GNAT family N-acyltransferase
VTAGSVRVRVATDPAELMIARALEHDVFVAEGFTPASDLHVVEEYGYLDAQSRWILAERDGAAAGVLRLMAAGPHAVPALRHFPPFPGAHDALTGERYVEVGTLAVTGAHRGSDVGLHLYRAALHLSLQEGVTAWVAVLEQWLLEHLAASGFHFVPMGAPRFYMGGECLPARMILGDALARLHRQDAAMHAWMMHGLPVSVTA